MELQKYYDDAKDLLVAYFTYMYQKTGNDDYFMSSILIDEGNIINYLEEIINNLKLLKIELEEGKNVNEFR